MGEVTHAHACRSAHSRKYPPKVHLVLLCTGNTKACRSEKLRGVYRVDPVTLSQLPWDKPLTGCTQHPGNTSAQPSVCSASRLCCWKALVGVSPQNMFGTSSLQPFPVPLHRLVKSIPSQKVPLCSQEPVSQGSSTKLLLGTHQDAPALILLCLLKASRT